MRVAVIDAVVQADDPFRCARELGFAGVEVMLPRQMTDGALAALVGAKQRCGLEFPSLILGEHNVHGGIADADPDAAARARDDVLAALEWARALGADAILVPFFLAADLEDDAAFTRCARAFVELCPQAERRGVVLCFEGSLPADRILAIATQADSRAFGCHFDPANAVVAGLDPVAEARALGPLVRRVHLKDTRVGRGDCRLGDGRVDFAACAAVLADIGYDGWIVIEGPPGAPADLARDLSFARSVFPQLRS